MKFINTIATAITVSGMCVTAISAQAGPFAGIERAAPAIQTSEVQFKLPFGLSADKVRRQLRRDGYDEIDITYLGIIDAKADVCRRGTRYRVKLRANGTYEYRNEIGKCRKTIAAKDVPEIIRKDGFRQVDVEDDGRVPYVASGCRNGTRFSLEVNEYGDVKVRDRIADCTPNMLSPRQVRRALRKDGYNRIKFTDRTPPRYVIEACRRDRKIRLNIDRRGKIRDRERIGRCATEIKSSQISAILEKAGYDRVDVVDDKPPRYRAEACRGNDRIRIAISPWGERTKEKKIGECAPPVTAASLKEKLEASSQNFKAIRVREGKRYPFVANVCLEGKRLDLFFTRYGKYVSNRDDGKCQSPRLSKVYSGLSDDGLRNLQTYIEGCTRRGRRVRVTIDEYGTETARERVGRCN